MTPVTFDNLSRGRADLVRWGPLARGDILDPAALDETFQLYQPKSVIHFAALGYVGPETHLIPLAIDATTGRGPPLQIFGADYPTSDGTCERDFIHVGDLASAHVKALHHLNGGNAFLTVNLGTGRADSILEVVREVVRAMGRSVPTVWKSRRPGDPPTLVSDPSQA